MLAFLIRACVSALKKYPDFNAFPGWGAEMNLVLKGYYHIYLLPTPNGLVARCSRMPTRKADLIAKEMSELAAKAREGNHLRGYGWLLPFQSWRHLWYCLHADHQCPEVAILGPASHQTAMEWPRIHAPSHAAAVALL
jgi:pyruvate dehydrogenase E2 component (dihydrolipoamide acetyltransferase)